VDHVNSDYVVKYLLKNIEKDSVSGD